MFLQGFLYSEKKMPRNGNFLIVEKRIREAFVEKTSERVHIKTIV